MVILHILSSDDKYGSAQCFLELLMHEIKINGITPIVITPKNNDINNKCNELGVKNYVIKYRQFQIPKHDPTPIFILKYCYHTMMYYLMNYAAENKIISIIENDNVNIVHTNSSVIDIGSNVAKRTGLINFWHLREFGKEDFNFYSAKAGFLNSMNACQNRFLAISEVVRQTWIKRGLNPNKIITVYDGVDANRFVPKQNIENDNHKIKIVMCGSFCVAKNQKLLIKAVNELSQRDRENVIIDFYGKTDGTYFYESQKLVEEYRLENIVSFKGYINNVPEMLLKYDVGVLCSRAEAFGRVTAEYMMASLCTIAPASGANVEIIDDGCGLLYKEGDIHELSSIISSIIKGMVDYRSIGKKARSKAIDKYNINENADKIVNQFILKR